MFMSMICLNKNREKILKNIFFLAVILQSYTCIAEEVKAPIFCGARDELRILKTVPISQMNNTELLYSAEYLRDRSMSAQQRFFNYYWLKQNNEKMLTGGRAVSRVISRYFSVYFSSDSYFYHQYYDNSIFARDYFFDDPVFFDDGARHWHGSLISDFGKYRIRVSPKKFKLSFRKKI